MLRKNGCTTSSQTENSSNDGMKFSPILPWAKFSTVFERTPNVSVLASMKQAIAAPIMTKPPKAVAPVPIEKIIGRDIVEARGGRVESVGYIEGASTTGIIEKIVKLYR